MESQCELDPDVWSKLPRELLQCIFARLPTAAIVRLRALSKSWRTAASSHCAFTRACGQAQPDLYAVMWFVSPTMMFVDTGAKSFEPVYTKLYDAASGEWRGTARWGLDGVQTPPGVRSVTESRMRNGIETADSPNSFFAHMVCDGGLVCLVSLSYRMDLLPLIVGNPLTCSWRQLPVHRLVKRIESVQLKVDCESGSYSVVIVGHVGRFLRSNAVAELYDSRTNHWSRLGFDRLVLTFHTFLRKDQQLQLFDCAAETLRNCVPPELYDVVLQYTTHLNDLYALEWLPGSEGSLLKLAVAKYEDGMNWRPPAPAPAPVIRHYACERPYFLASNVLLLVSGKFYVVVWNELHVLRLMMFFGGEWHESDWEAGVCPFEELCNMCCAELRWDACP